MFGKGKNLILFITLVSLIYVLRDNQTSPLGFLQREVVRILANQQISQKLCDGIDRTNDISANERSRVDGYKSSLAKIRKGNPFVQFIEGPYSSDKFPQEYIAPSIAYGAIWFVFFGLSLLGCLFYLVNWCWMYVCSCGPECCKLPTSDRFKKPYMIGSVLFMLGLVGAGIAGIVVSPGFSKGGNEMICSAGIFMDKVIEGSQQERWIGAQPAIDKLMIVINNINDIASQINPIFIATSATVTAPYTAAAGSVTTMYATFFTRTINRGDPTSTQLTYKPTYIQNLNTETGTIKSEMDAKKSTVDGSAQKLDTSITLLKGGSFLLTLLGELENAKERFTNVSNSISELQANFTRSGGDAQTVFRGVGGAFIAIFAVQVVVAILAMLSMVFVCKGIFCFNKLIHLSWCVIGIFMILSWAVSSVLFPVTIMLFEGCEVVQKFTTDPTFYNKTYDKFLLAADETSDNSSTKNTLYRCLHGDADLVAEFNLKDNLFVFYDIAQALDDTVYLTPSQQTVVDSVQIPLHQKRVSDYKQGLMIDAPEVTQDLDKLNGFTNGNQCSQMKDKWYINSVNCVSNDGSVFQASYAPDFNIRNPTCIGFDIWKSKSTSDISQRYTFEQFPLALCGPVGAGATNLQNYVNRFQSARNSVDALFGEIQNSPSGLSGVSSLNGVYMTAIKSLMTSWYDPFRQTYAPIYNALSDKNNGVLTNLQCQFIKQSMIDFEDRLCVRFGSSVFQIVVVFIIVSFMGFFGTFMLFCLAKRFLQGQEKKGANYEVVQTNRYGGKV